MRFTFSRKKRPSEKLALTIDFVGDLDTGDTLAQVTMKATDANGNDVTGTVIANSSVNGTQATAVMQAGVDGVTYTLNYKVLSLAGYKYEHDLCVPVLATA